MDEDDFDVTEVSYAATELRPIDVVITVLAAVSSFVDDIVNLLCRHANWKVERRRMEREARETIERIVSGE